MSCPDHPQWYHDREDCPFCAVTLIRTEQQRRATVSDDQRDHQIAALIDEIHQWRKTVSYAVGDMADTETPESCRAAMMQHAAQDGRERDTLHTQIAALRAENAALRESWDMAQQRHVIRMKEAEARITALQAERAKLFKELAYEVDQRQQVEAEYTAAEQGLAEWQARVKSLQAEQAQWRQATKALQALVIETERCDKPGDYGVGVTDDVYLNAVKVLAALTAQQEKPDGDV